MQNVAPNKNRSKKDVRTISFISSLQGLQLSSSQVKACLLYYRLIVDSNSAILWPYMDFRVVFIEIKVTLEGCACGS